MATTVSQSEAIEMFDLPTEVLYVCDGKKGCGKPSCLDYDSSSSCHHTSDLSHALYGEHDQSSFSSHPSVRDGAVTIILVEQIRG